LEVATNDGVDKHARLLLSVTRGCVNDERLDDNRPFPVRRRVQRRYRLVIRQPVVPAHHAEANDVALVVEDLEAFGAVGGRQARDNADLPDGADVAVAVDDVAALDEVLVRLWVVEAPHDWPDGGDRGGDLLRQGRAALVRPHRVGVVPRDGVRHRRGGARYRAPTRLRLLLA